MSLVFEAATAGGVLRIVLAQPAGDAVGSMAEQPVGDAVGSMAEQPVGDAVAAALALAEHEALIVALEAWLQQPLDPRPLLPTDAAAHDADPDLLWADCGGLRLGFAWSLLLNAASVPSASALPVAWPELAFEIDVAEFSTDPRPAAAQPAAPQPPESHADPADAVLLLPPAFEPTWRVLLHGVATQTTPPLWADAEWRGPGTAPLLCGAPQAGRRRRAAWRVQLDTRYQRPLPELLGWVTSADAEGAAPPPRPSGAAHLIAPGQPAQRGSIAPALGGAGLWISG